MISFDEAHKLLFSIASPLISESVPISEASGRRLAAPVLARIDQPRSDQSAMDGYAVRAGDAPTLTEPFRLVGESRPGAPFSGSIGEQEAVRIFTGAPVPEGADRVLVQEIVERHGDSVRLTGEYGRGRHIRRKGSDFIAGANILTPGQLLHPRAIVAAAGSDNATLTVWRRPRVAIIATGDELVAPGKAAESEYAVAESLAPGLTAMVGRHGGTVVRHARLSDDLPRLHAEAEKALAAADLIVTTGGASVGEHDHAKAMFEPHGLDLIFSKVSIKPGKPVWLGRAGGKAVLGLPGNPTSAMVTARLFLVPLLLGLGGGKPAEALDWHMLPLAEALPATGARETFRRGTARDGKVWPSRNEDSGAQAALVVADRLIRCPAGEQPMDAGMSVQTLDF